MAKLKSKKELEERAKAVFLAKKECEVLYVAADGNCFYEASKGAADNHARKIGQPLLTLKREDVFDKKTGDEKRKKGAKNPDAAAGGNTGEEAGGNTEAEKEKASAEVARDKAKVEAKDKAKAEKEAQKAEKLKAVASAKTEEELIDLKIGEKDKEVKAAIDERLKEFENK